MPFYVRLVAALCATVLLALCPALAQDYPAREIHSIVNFPPGTGMDIMNRWYGAKLSELIGKPVIVENKPGALGNIASEYVARAKPDGYTIMITPASSTFATAVSGFQKASIRSAQGLRSGHADLEARLRRGGRRQEPGH
jgi:tripartite-type tricarboxylate transporter receptor subunit TctC